MDTLLWIVVGGGLMSAIAMVGGLTTFLPPPTLQRGLLPLVSLSAGTLLGGAFFHMIPQGSEGLPSLVPAAWVVAGFSVFLGLEQFLRWHHTHRDGATADQPVVYLILVGDAAHNLLGGLGIASTFLLDARAGIIAWFAAAAHEIPQELGDFGVLVHAGWSRRRALSWNVVSALTFPLGALIAYAAAWRFDLRGLVLFGAGNFIYIAASDLIPEIKQHTRLGASVLHFGVFVVGASLMFALAAWLPH